MSKLQTVKNGNDLYSLEVPYSLQEQKIGTWIDGKIIYRKVIDLGTMPNKTSKDVTVNITDVQEITSVKALCSNGNEIWTIPNAYSTNYVMGLVIRTFNKTISNISIYSSSDASSFYGKAILEYTKTTS